MSSRYDLENLLSDVKKLMVANLNDAIAAVEAEKEAQGLPVIDLKPVDTAIGQDGNERGFFLQDWSDRILNASPAIFYGLEKPDVVGIGPALSQKYRIFIDVVVTDAGQDLLRNQRVNRYTRALLDFWLANWDKLPCSAKTKVETVKPLSFKIDENSSEEIRVGGIVLTVDLAS